MVLKLAKCFRLYKGNKMKRSNVNWLYYCLIILLCVYILSPIFQIAVYNRPSADDYDYGLRTHMALVNGGGLVDLVKAAWDMVVSAYNSFSGLYTSAFILALHPGIWSEKMYSLSTWIVFAVIFFATFWSVFILNRQFLKKPLLFVVAASLVLITILLLWLPSACQGLYWYNGAMNYMPYVFMNMLNLCLLLEADSSISRCKGKILVCLSMVLSFLISGGNHVTSFANILMLLFAACYKATKKQFYILLPLMMACLGFLIMYLSPGTQWRQHYFVDSNGGQSVLGTIIATIKHWIYIVGDWISIVWLLSLAVITPTTMEVVIRNPKICPKHFPIIPILLSAAVVSGMFCVPYMAMGEFGEGRVTNVIWIMFMVLSWLNYVLIWGWLHRNGYINLQKILEKKHAAITGFLVVCVCLFALFRCHDDTMSVSMWAIHEMEMGIAQSHAQQMDDRIAQYKDDTLVEVAVAPMQNPSDLLLWGEVQEDPDVWPNTSVGNWYGGKKIYLLPSTEE